METPSSTRRVTRSQTLSSASKSINNIPVSRKIDDSESSMSKSRQRGTQQQQDRSALIDITNDSPIVGVANGGNLETPLGAKQRGGSSRVKKTPGSGEALLRCQVKTLLQKVEEEAVLSKISLESRPFLELMSSSSSPIGLLAPTPANTPQIPNLSDFSVNGSTVSSSVTPSPIAQELLVSQFVDQIFDGKNEESSESEKSLITRSLLLDFSEKSEISDASEECSSEMSEVVQGSVVTVITEDDDASVWSIQVNASTHDDDDVDDYDEEVAGEDGDYYEDAEGEEEVEGGYDDDDEEDDDGGLMLDELCEGLNKISMNEGVGGAKFEGKHTRFEYDSDDELIKEEEDGNNGAGFSSNVLHLKGLPTPKGKHLRFSEEGH